VQGRFIQSVHRGHQLSSWSSGRERLGSLSHVPFARADR
jgi:hypothetical protein